MSKSKNLFKNINFAILGLVVMATSTALIDLAGAFKTIATVLLANLALHFISWLLICFSMYKMQNLDKRTLSVNRRRNFADRRQFFYVQRV